MHRVRTDNILGRMDGVVMLADDDDQFTFNETQAGSVSADTAAETEMAESTVMGPSDSRRDLLEGAGTFGRLMREAGQPKTGSNNSSEGARHGMPPRPDRQSTSSMGVRARQSTAGSGSAGSGQPAVADSELAPSNHPLALAIGAKRMEKVR